MLIKKKFLKKILFELRALFKKFSDRFKNFKKTRSIRAKASSIEAKPKIKNVKDISVRSSIRVATNAAKQYKIIQTISDAKIKKKKLLISMKKKKKNQKIMLKKFIQLNIDTPS